MSVMVLDAGNSIIKAKIARRDRGEVSFPDALRKLTETEYSMIISRPGISVPPLDYIRVNGQPYVIGKGAERHGIITQRAGTAWYTEITTEYLLLQHLVDCMIEIGQQQFLEAIHQGMCSSVKT